MTGADVCLSFNEVETLGVKAARGAGLGWGQAEDLGRAGRWLAERGFDWASTLLLFLEDADAPRKAARLAEAADRAFSATVGESWTVGGLAPALVAPMLAASIFGRNHGLRVEWRDQALSLAPNGSAWSSHREIDLASDAMTSIRALHEEEGWPVRVGALSDPKKIAYYFAVFRDNRRRRLTAAISGGLSCRNWPNAIISPIMRS